MMIHLTTREHDVMRLVCEGLAVRAALDPAAIVEGME